MRAFNLEEAKAGKKVCTRDGRPVRVICWDALGHYKVIALTTIDEGLVTYERPDSYTVNGLLFEDEIHPGDLMMEE